MSKDDSQTISLTRADLADIIGKAVTAAIAGVKAQAAEPEKPRLTPEAIHADQVARGELIENEQVPCRDPRTGYTFVANVQKGRVTQITSESLPDEMAFPQGMYVREPDGRLTQAAKQLIYTTMRRPVLDLSGKPLPLSFRIDAQAHLAEAEKRIAAGL